MNLIDNDEHSVSMFSLTPFYSYFAPTSLSTTDPLTLRDRALARFVPSTKTTRHFPNEFRIITVDLISCLSSVKTSQY